MVLPKRSPDDGSMRLSLISRSARTLEAYIRGPLKEHFLSDDYAFGVAERRGEVHKRLSSASAKLFLLTTLLAFFDSVVGSDVSFFGMDFTIKPVFASAVCFVTASAFLATVLASLDALLIDRYLATIGYTIRLYSFGLYVLPKSAINLWAEAMVPKMFGPKSAFGHRFALATVATVQLTLMALLALYPTIVCISQISTILERPEKTIAEVALSGFSLLIISIAWLLILGFAFPFKFRAADFNEADGTPTPEFLARSASAEADHPRVKSAS